MTTPNREETCFAGIGFRLLSVWLACHMLYNFASFVIAVLLAYGIMDTGALNGFYWFGKNFPWLHVRFPWLLHFSVLEWLMPAIVSNMAVPEAGYPWSVVLFRFVMPAWALALACRKNGNFIPVLIIYCLFQVSIYLVGTIIFELGEYEFAGRMARDGPYAENVSDMTRSIVYMLFYAAIGCYAVKLARGNGYRANSGVLAPEPLPIGGWLYLFPFWLGTALVLLMVASVLAVCHLLSVIDLQAGFYRETAVGKQVAALAAGVLFRWGEVLFRFIMLATAIVFLLTKSRQFIITVAIYIVFCLCAMTNAHLFFTSSIFTYEGVSWPSREALISAYRGVMMQSLLWIVLYLAAGLYLLKSRRIRETFIR